MKSNSIPLSSWAKTHPTFPMNVTNLYKHAKIFPLENGKKLRNLEIAFHTYGKYNPNKNNVIWVCHALTGNSDVFDWWEGLFGENKLFNPKEHFIVCANIIGSAYGSSNPLSINPITNQPYYLSFPEFTTKDIAQAHQILAQHLGIKQIHTLIGASLGGQQALEFTLLNKISIEHMILIACNAVHSPWGIAFNESQRLAISTDRTFYANSPEGGLKGLQAARSIALLSYRTSKVYNNKQSEVDTNKINDFKASSYQRYQGEKLVKRFNAYSYWYLTKAMDSHHIGRGRESVENALQSIQSKCLIIGIDSDLLFPIAEQRYLAKEIPQAQLAILSSDYGHDGFLVETQQLEKIIHSYYEKSENQTHTKLNITA